MEIYLETRQGKRSVLKLLVASPLFLLAYLCPNLSCGQTVSIDGINFSIPAGCKLEKVADQPFIRWPIAADWGKDGSLVVLESNWNRESVHQQLNSKPHRIVRLSDSDGDGRYDKRKLVADQLSFSAGVLVCGDAIFVSTPPAILKLTDPDGDGFFDTRESWYDGTTLTHCANDLHGPFLGPEGWIYWTKGAFAEQRYDTILGKTVTSKAAHLLRRHPQGGPVDILMSGGMDNPVDVTFLPNGERIFCSTFMHHPGDGLRDGIGHAIYGSLFGKAHAPLDGHYRTGPLFTPIAELGPAAPAAVMTASPKNIIHHLPFFPESTTHYQTIVSAQFNLQQLEIHRLIPAGGTFETLSQELLTADRVDFHPVDCLEEPDGNLLILDTGGWYDLCCPSSGTPGQVAPGGIYRLSLNQPAKDAINTDAVTANISGDLSNLWTLAKSLVSDPNNSTAISTIIDALKSSHANVRQGAANIVSLYRWEAARPNLINLLTHPATETSTPDDAAHTRRLAAECLGRLKNSTSETFEVLLRALETQQPDRIADHAILYALIELGEESVLRAALTSQSPRRQWAGLICLQQLNAIAHQDCDRLFELTETPDANVRTQAIATLASQTHLADFAIPKLKSLWQLDKDSSSKLFSSVLNNWSIQPAMQAFVAENLRNWDRLSLRQKELIRTALRGIQGNTVPDGWREPLLTVLRQADEEARSVALALKGVTWPAAEDQPILKQLIALADQPGLDLETRLGLLELLPNQTAGVPEELVDQVLRGVIGEEPTVSSRCATILRKLPLSVQQAKRLVHSLDDMASNQLQNAVLAIVAANVESLDQQLLEKIPKLQAARTLSVDPIQAAVASRPISVRQAYADVFRKLHSPPADIEMAVTDFLAKLPPGDPIEGYQVFRDSKGSCAGCHRIGYVGGRIGPELTRIGRSRTKFDLAEAILYPNARIEQSYQSTRVLTEDGRVYNGLLANVSDSHLELMTGVEQKEIIPLNEIERREPSPLSVMPSGLESVLTLQQFADLLAFLQDAK